MLVTFETKDGRTVTDDVASAPAVDGLAQRTGRERVCLLWFLLHVKAFNF